MSIWKFFAFGGAAILVGFLMFIFKRFTFDKDSIKIKTRYVSVFFIITSLLSAIAIICYTIFLPLSLMPFIISAGIFAVDFIFLFFCLDRKLDVLAGIVYLVLGSFVISSVFALILSDSLSHNHKVVYDYEIFILEDEVKVEYDESVEGFEEFIDETVKGMKKYGSSFHTGSIEVSYKCYYPLVKGHEENCTCTDREICSECKEYINQQVSLKEIEH